MLGLFCRSQGWKGNPEDPIPWNSDEGEITVTASHIDQLLNDVVHHMFINQSSVLVNTLHQCVVDTFKGIVQEPVKGP
jgi:hypothetical protein